ncbi:MAG: FAD-dependent oxidoreductase, partial [Clostridia bacterium]|nr:FAD-dependent oxidoreductase [Clostridia bacterium]
HDTEMHTPFADSVGMVSDWRKRGPVYEVPFATLYSPVVKNLIMAGRVTSVTDSMWDIMRVIPCCAVTGQAAGTAAAMGDDFTALDVTALQDALRQDGVVIHEADL